MKASTPVMLSRALLMALACAGTAVAADVQPPTEPPAAVQPAAEPPAAAEPVSEAVAVLQQRWAEIKYGPDASSREEAWKALADQAAAARAASGDDPRVLIWEGIILASQAGDAGGFGALSLAKRARADFEAAIAKDRGALDGSALVSLGSLYYQVPGWPLGFGDDKRARALLEEGVAVDPDGIDSNWFLADFLRDQGEYAAAEAALRKAMAAPPRPGRELADRGRQAEIAAAMVEVQRRLRRR